jgi:uncharacterized protein (DUF1778 family)
LQAQITPDALAVVKRAAEIQGRGVSGFVVAAAQQAARKTIEETQVVRLSLEDKIAFAEAISTPPFKASTMKPTRENGASNAKIIDSRNFPASAKIASAWLRALPQQAAMAHTNLKKEDIEKIPAHGDPIPR